MADSLGYVPDPDHPGCLVRPASTLGRFLDIYGEMRVCAEGENRARLRLTPDTLHRNLKDAVHGGFLMAIVDHALFAGPLALGIEGAASGVTIDATTQFLAPVATGRPVDVIIEVLRETGRMVFARGLIEQDGTPAVSFSGTIKKGPQGR